MHLAIRARRRARRAQHRELAWHAWTNAALQRAKKLPPLAKLLGETVKKARMTWQQMKLSAQAWHAAAGARPARGTAASDRIRSRLAKKT